MHILKTQLSDDCKTFVVYSVEITDKGADWRTAVLLYETGDRAEADAFAAWGNSFML